METEGGMFKGKGWLASAWTQPLWGSKHIKHGVEEDGGGMKRYVCGGKPGGLPHTWEE